jgi:hypothetical protein
MATIGVFEPNATSQQAFGSIQGLRMTPGAVFALDGPDGLGPESAGAVIVLHTTLASDEGAQRFFQRNAELMRTLRGSSGFIRFMGMFDGPSGYGVGFWKTPEDALAFSKGPLHGALVKDLFREPYMYTQFAGIWAAHTIRPRRFFCEKCQHATPAPADACARCGNALVDVFKQQVVGSGGARP